MAKAIAAHFSARQKSLSQIVSKGYSFSMSEHDPMTSLIGLMDKALEPDQNPDDQVKHVVNLFDAIDALVVDITVPAEDRAFAIRLKANIVAHAQTATGTAIAALSQIASSETTPPETRAVAKRTLQNVAVQLREQGGDISQWVDPGTSRLQ